MCAISPSLCVIFWLRGELLLSELFHAKEAIQLAIRKGLKLEESSVSWLRIAIGVRTAENTCSRGAEGDCADVDDRDGLFALLFSYFVKNMSFVATAAHRT